MKEVTEKLQEIKDLLADQYGIKLEDISIEINVDNSDTGTADQMSSDIHYTSGYQTHIILKDNSFEASHRLIENVSDKIAIRLMDAQYVIR